MPRGSVRDSKIFWYAVEGLVGLQAFLLVASIFPSGGSLVSDKRLTDFWIIPVLFVFVAVLLTKIAEDGESLPRGVYVVYSALASGTWLGLSFGAVLILNQWYAAPGDGHWEPLFTATGLSSAGVLAADRAVRRLHKRKPTRSTQELVLGDADSQALGVDKRANNGRG